MIRLKGNGLSENIWFNLLWFQAYWWLSILFANSVILPLLCLLSVHLWLHRQWQRELLIIISCGACGFAVDSFLTLLGFFRFSPASLLPPLWLFLLWLGFAATLCQGLKFFAGRWYLAMLAGALGGTSSYFAAAGLGAVTLGWSFRKVSYCWRLSGRCCFRA